MLWTLLTWLNCFLTTWIFWTLLTWIIWLPDNSDVMNSVNLANLLSDNQNNLDSSDNLDIRLSVISWALIFWKFQVSAILDGLISGNPQAGRMNYKGERELVPTGWTRRKKNRNWKRKSKRERHVWERERESNKARNAWRLLGSLLNELYVKLVCQFFAQKTRLTGVGAGPSSSNFSLNQ